MKETVVLGKVAHGGHVVARIDGKVTFVTGGLPGERVSVEVTEQGKRFDRGRVVDVLEAHPERVDPVCPVAGACGGCDWQHASGALQRALKAQVVAEQLERLAGLRWDITVEAVPPLLGWRTRMRYLVGDGVVGLRGRRSHELVPVPAGGCPIAAGPAPSPVEGAAELVVTDSSAGRTVLADGKVIEGEPVVREHAGGRAFAVDAAGFWQVHPEAAELLSQVVLEGLAPEPGERAVDLYCGVGLFAGALDAAGCRVSGIELAKRAVEHARRNVPGARFEAGPVERFLRRLPNRTDLVVLDPPRKGAGAKVVEAVVGSAPRAVAYVACDPAALARDLATFASHGYVPTSIRAFDLFPQTAHVECVAILARGE